MPIPRPVVPSFVPSVVLSLVLATALMGTAMAQVRSDTITTRAGEVTVSAVVTGLDTPWAFGFLPGGDIVLTERDGRVLIVAPGQGVAVLRNPPQVHVNGQGGLLDVLVPRDFAQSRELFFTHAKRQGGASGTAVTRAVLTPDGIALMDHRTIFEIEPGSRGGRHFGARIAEAPDGTLFLTVGDRGDRRSAQDRSLHNGSVLRIKRDGSVPDDNPFVGASGVQPEIWSYGHRNPQGAALGPDGILYIAEHGARGGDEVNRITKGANYGWPVISYGRHYSGAKIGEGTVKEGMEQPIHYWDPSIAPSGMMFHTGKALPAWRGDAFVGSLKFDHISRLSGNPLREVERLQSPETLRVRDVIQGPDGAIWFLSEGQGALYRISRP